jgi:hypothetical protein
MRKKAESGTGETGETRKFHADLLSCLDGARKVTRLLTHSTSMSEMRACLPEKTGEQEHLKMQSILK